MGRPGGGTAAADDAAHAGIIALLMNTMDFQPSGWPVRPSGAFCMQEPQGAYQGSQALLSGPVKGGSKSCPAPYAFPEAICHVIRRRGERQAHPPFPFSQDDIRAPVPISIDIVVAAAYTVTMLIRFMPHRHRRLQGLPSAFSATGSSRYAGFYPRRREESALRPLDCLARGAWSAPFPVG